jgi:serine/threonine-protein phosphatase 5
MFLRAIGRIGGGFEAGLPEVCRSKKFGTKKFSSVSKREAEKHEAEKSAKGDISPSYVRDVVMKSFKRGKLLSAKDISLALQTVKKRLEALPNVMPVHIPKDGSVTIVGDIHGQFDDLCHILGDQIGGCPSENNIYVFNGDFVDRGHDSVSVIMTLFLLKLAFPQSVHLIRGNHESAAMNYYYGFAEELTSKYPDEYDSLAKKFHDVFNTLPLAAVVEDEVFVVHGGLGPHTSEMLIEEMNTQIHRFEEPHFDNMERPTSMAELLWADPMPANGFSPSVRENGIMNFGPDVTAKFLKLNNLKRIVRSHEMVRHGYCNEHGDMLTTVFSAPDYRGRSNAAAILRFMKTKDGLKQTIIQYNAV